MATASARQPLKERLVIRIMAREGDRTVVEPDPAVGTVGQDVVWKVYYEHKGGMSEDPINWTLYFSGSSPFKDLPKGRTIMTHPEAEGELVAGSASFAGDYKYGVRVSNARTRETISDDDPRLIVRER